MSATKPVEWVRTQTAEDVARAGLYALLARLFYSAPDADVLAAIVNAPNVANDEASPLGAAWRELQQAAVATTPAQAADEYTRLFVGVGKASVSIYASHYLTENYKELTLVHLRDELDRLGLARKGAATEPEDHLAGLLEVMRYLVQRNDSDPAKQSGFFTSYLKPWCDAFCQAVADSDSAVFYLTLSRMMKVYFTIEVEYFEWTV